MIGKIFWRAQIDEWSLCIEPAAKLLQLYKLSSNEYKVMCLGCQHILFAESLVEAKQKAVRWFGLIMYHLKLKLENPDAINCD